jgi:hypothetical protein
VRSPIPGGPSLLLALPPGAANGDWLDDWRLVLDAWPGDWHILDSDPHYVASWRRRALEHCAGCWTVLPDPGYVPGALAFSLALRAMADDPGLSCVSIVEREAVSYCPEITEATPPFYSARYVTGGVLLVKGPLAAKVALPRPEYYPYDFAEASFRMTEGGLRALLLPDPSLILRRQARSLSSMIRGSWREGRGSAAFRLAHKCRAPRSLRLPRRRVELLLLAPWLLPATAWRIYLRDRRGGREAGRLDRTLGPLFRSAALWAGTLSGYSIK